MRKARARVRLSTSVSLLAHSHSHHQAAQHSALQLTERLYKHTIPIASSHCQIQHSAVPLIGHSAGVFTPTCCPMYNLHIAHTPIPSNHRQAPSSAEQHPSAIILNSVFSEHDPWYLQYSRLFLLTSLMTRVHNNRNASLSASPKSKGIYLYISE